MKSYIVMPGMIYGEVVSPLVDAGLQYSRSRPIPMFLRPSISRGQAGVIGKGLSRWANVHVDDVADLFLLLWNAIVSGSEKAGHGWEGFYIAASDESDAYEYAKETARVLVELGLSTSTEVSSFTPEEVSKYYPSVSSSTGDPTEHPLTNRRVWMSRSALMRAAVVPTLMRLDGSPSTRRRTISQVSKMKWRSS